LEDGERRGEERKGEFQRPGREAKSDEMVSGVTTEGRRRERDIRINIDNSCESMIRYSEGGRRKRRVRWGKG